MEMTQIFTSLNDYTDIQQISKGGYGEIFRAIHKPTQKQVCLKRFLTTNCCLDGFSFNTLREIKYLMDIDHPNIIQILDIFVHEGTMYMATEYMNGGDMHKLIYNNQQKLNIQIIKSIFYQMLLAFEHLHSKNLSHRDVKMDNFLVKRDGSIVLIDFGNCRIFSSNGEGCTDEARANHQFNRPPELLVGNGECSYYSDVWGLGCILFQLLSGKTLFRPPKSRILNDLSVLSRIFSILGQPTQDMFGFGIPYLPGITAYSKPNVGSGLEEQIVELSTIPNIPDSCIDLLKKMLSIPPLKRPTIKECLEHPFFSEAPSLLDFPLQSFIHTIPNTPYMNQTFTNYNCPSTLQYVRDQDFLRNLGPVIEGLKFQETPFASIETTPLTTVNKEIDYDGIFDEKVFGNTPIVRRLDFNSNEGLTPNKFAPVVESDSDYD
eukprot:TRINITY_DN11676_c0_g1_i1.p1 TRINITY_DN11676_c0_g1~~TRINITY_DN11676_c0_g1_i1.p1  ORF type:complete len:445 (+),score=81.65 TRINITY_DN11676_c0_g1_i1:38-1336(+)